MPFENGFPIEESIKIELYNFEPEQLSDLVYVPIHAKLTVFLSRFFYIDNQSNPINIVRRFINFPFNFSVLTSNEARPTRNIPMLFQRFNPYNKPFADGYSKKLFDFFNQFSNYTLYRSLGHFARRVNDNNLPDVLELNQLYLDNYVFDELTINTPNNALKIELSYYYAEINPEEVSNSYIYLNQKVIYSRISNQCIQTERSRAWLIEFNELLSNGETFIIKDNILVGSLIINFIDNPSLELYWTKPDKDYILSQIPDYYFYDNLDVFFKMITNEILNQDPNILKEVEVPTELNYNFSIGRLQSFSPNLTLANYQQTTLDLYPRLLLYANNNNWNNTYEWVNNNNGTTYTDIKNLIHIDYQLNTVNFQTEDDSIITINRVDTFLNDLDSGFNNDYNRYNASDRFRHRTNDTVAIYKRNGITYDGLFYAFDVNKSFFETRHQNAPIHRLIYDYANNIPVISRIRGERGFRASTQDEYVYSSYILSWNLATYNYSYFNNYNGFSPVEGERDFLINPLDNITDDINYKNLYRTTTYILATQLKELILTTTAREAFDKIIQAHEDCYKVANCDLEDIKKDIKEIHAALDAGKFAYLDGSTEQQRVSNIGYYVERIARVLGISVNSDGSIRSIRQSKIIEKGDTVPNGWNIAQWGRNNGENTQGQEGGLSSEERDGIAWEIKSNKFITDSFTGEPTEIAQGGYALVENIPQLLHLIFEDLDRAFGLQDAGANVIPSPDGKQIVSYQGINTMLLDILYMLSMMSRNTSGAHICGLKNQAMLQEVLGALGQPVGVKEIEVTVANGQKLPIPVPGTLPGNPTLSDMFMIILLNLGLLVGSKIDVKPEDKDKKNNS